MWSPIEQKSFFKSHLTASTHLIEARVSPRRVLLGELDRPERDEKKS
jgi:hypothetical protein